VPPKNILDLADRAPREGDHRHGLSRGNGDCGADGIKRAKDTGKRPNGKKRVRIQRVDSLLLLRCAAESSSMSCQQGHRAPRSGWPRTGSCLHSPLPMNLIFLSSAVNASSRSRLPKYASYSVRNDLTVSQSDDERVVYAALCLIPKNRAVADLGIAA